MTNEQLDFLNSLEEGECHFFSNEGKKDRERFIAIEFLQNIGIKPKTDELTNANEYGIVDIIYKTSEDQARFEIKVIPNIYWNNDQSEIDKLTGAYKKISKIVKKNAKLKISLDGEAINKALNSQFLDNNGNPRAFDIVNEDGYTLLKNEIRKFSEVYLDRGIDLTKVDLLIYCLRRHASKFRKNQINYSDFEHGWRSVSCLMGNQAYILYSSENAPSFLRKK